MKGPCSTSEGVRLLSPASSRGKLPERPLHLEGSLPLTWLHLLPWRVALGWMCVSLTNSCVEAPAPRGRSQGEGLLGVMRP